GGCKAGAVSGALATCPAPVGEPPKPPSEEEGPGSEGAAGRATTGWGTLLGALLIGLALARV
ncbi:MAG TPA: hypothetical protein VFH51_12905, partial [Myxococcota bacterium]|nr:hypothetical protein [Myxococcota bacterium]